MRDLLVFALVIGSLPIILVKPFFGVLVWTWLGLMNPHMLLFSFARGQPFAQLVAGVLLFSMLATPKEHRWPPAIAVTILLGGLWVWMGVTTLTAINPDYSGERLLAVSKILLMTFVVMAMLTSKARIIALVWVAAFSIAFYGIKGGVFTLTTGGGEHVWGPESTFIGGNNEIGLALNMTVPLLRFLQLYVTSPRIKLAIMGVIGLCVVAILGTQSRGALVGLVVMGLWLIIKSPRKVPILAMLAFLAVPAVLFMPASWYERMDTIDSYEQDASAMGRINAWWAAYYLALDNPMGGGLASLQQPKIMLAYAPQPKFNDVHSIFFQVLADLGFFGLGLYLVLGMATLAAVRSIIRDSKADPRLRWMGDLSAMIYVSLAAFAASGAFLGLAYFDYMFTIMALVVGMRGLLNRYKLSGIPDEPAPGELASVKTGFVPGRVRAIRQQKPLTLVGKVKAWFAEL